MAIKLLRTLASGYDAEYWKVKEVNINFISNTCVIRIYLYKDAKARNQGAEPVTDLEYIYDFTKAQAENNNAQQLAYKLLKDNVLKDGEDV